MQSRLRNISDTGLVFEAEGSTGLLDGPTCALLLSRQARRPDPRDKWIHAVRASARWAAMNEMAMIAGGGLMHLDFARWASHSVGKTVWVDVGDAMKAKSTAAAPPAEPWCDLHIKARPRGKITRRELMLARDRAAAGLADALIAIAVQKGGVMERLGREAIKTGKKVYALEPLSGGKECGGNASLIEKGAEKLHLEFSVPGKVAPDKLKDAITAPEMENGASTSSYIWHFTRECPGPWPGESWGKYFSSLAAGEPSSAHTAMDTLARILSEERLRASGRMIRGGYNVVCWAGNRPEDLMERRKYRSALVRWEYQPYAVGIKRDVALKLGLKQAITADPKSYSSIPEEDRYRYQAPPTGKNTWAEDEEWRNSGDFLLTDVHPSEGIVLVKDPEERDAMLRISRFPVISMKLGL